MKARTRKRPLRWYVIWTFIFGFFAVTLIVFLLSLPLWNIREIKVEGCQMLVADEIRQIADIPLGENVFFVSFEKAKKKLSQIIPIEEFRILRIPPSTILIKIKERIPVVTASIDNSSVVLDKEGYILNLDPNLSGVTINLPDISRLPVINGIKKSMAQDGKRLNNEISLLIFHLFTQFSKSFERAKLQLQLENLENINLLIDDVIKIKIGDTVNLEKKIKVFKALLSKVSDKTNQLEYIDVRFPDWPVVKFK